MMQEFVCHCKWTYIIGEKHVYGPIFEDRTAHLARMMPRQEFEDGYTDCAYDYQKAIKG